MLNLIGCALRKVDWIENPEALVVESVRVPISGDWLKLASELAMQLQQALQQTSGIV